MLECSYKYLGMIHRGQVGNSHHFPTVLNEVLKKSITLNYLKDFNSVYILITNENTFISDNKLWYFIMYISFIEP